jgi:hypothetical protein
MEIFLKVEKLWYLNWKWRYFWRWRNFGIWIEDEDIFEGGETLVFELKMKIFLKVEKLWYLNYIIINWRWRYFWRWRWGIVNEGEERRWRILLLVSWSHVIRDLALKMVDVVGISDIKHFSSLRYLIFFSRHSSWCCRFPDFCILSIFLYSLADDSYKT